MKRGAVWLRWVLICLAAVGVEVMIFACSSSTGSPGSPSVTPVSNLPGNIQRYCDGGNVIYYNTTSGSISAFTDTSICH